MLSLRRPGSQFAAFANCATRLVVPSGAKRRGNLGLNWGKEQIQRQGCHGLRPDETTSRLTQISKALIWFAGRRNDRLLKHNKIKNRISWSGKVETQRLVVSWIAGQVVWKDGELGFSLAFPARLARMNLAAFHKTSVCAWSRRNSWLCSLFAFIVIKMCENGPRAQVWWLVK